jgi:uncharacterized protein
MKESADIPIEDAAAPYLPIKSMTERTMSKETNSFAGKWALITGASGGLGTEFGDLLAAQKVSLVLVARRQESMETLASDLRRKYGVDVLVEAIDLASPGGQSAEG